MCCVKNMQMTGNYVGTRVFGYVVSNRCDNPKQLYGKKVYRIEGKNRHYDCMILAVNGEILWQVRDEIVHMLEI